MKLNDYFKRRESVDKRKLQQEMYKFAHGKQGWMAQHGYKDSSQMTESGAWPQFKADFKKHQDKMKQLRQNEQESRSKAKPRGKAKESPEQKKRESKKIKSLSPGEARKETQKVAARKVLGAINERHNAPKNKRIYYRRKNIHGINAGRNGLRLGPRNIAASVNKHVGGYTYNSRGQKSANAKLKKFDNDNPDQGRTFGEKLAVFKKALILSMMKTNDDVYSSKLANDVSPVGMKKNLKEHREKRRAKRILKPHYGKRVAKYALGRAGKVGKHIVNGVHAMEKGPDEHQKTNNDHDSIIKAQRKRNIQHNLQDNDEDELGQ